jgi:membrane protein insertase Oxa1/YidC/SpoIIIJ
MTPEVFRAWHRVFRDFALVAVATFIMIWQTVAASDPNAILVGAAIAIYGLPPFLRLDEHRISSGSED